MPCGCHGRDCPAGDPVFGHMVCFRDLEQRTAV
jgi:hypothetical protein